MPVTVGVNNLSVVHKDSSGVTIAFPDVCKTPTPAGAAFPSRTRTSPSRATPPRAAKKVKCDGNPVCVKDSNFSMSTGDEAGSAGGGVVSNKIKGKAEFVNFSFDVKFEGKNVAARLDLMLHNDKNTPPFPVIQGPIIALPPDAHPECLLCGKKL